MIAEDEVGYPDEEYERPLRAYRVHMRSQPGPVAQYDGFVDVRAHNDDEAIERAFRKLKTGAFPDRSRSMWRVDRVERRL